MLGKKYKHGCSNCIYFGSWEFEEEHHDFYFCEQIGIPTILARYGDEEQEYTSGIHYVDESDVLVFGYNKLKEKVVSRLVNLHKKISDDLSYIMLYEKLDKLLPSITADMAATRMKIQSVVCALRGEDETED